VARTRLRAGREGSRARRDLFFVPGFQRRTPRTIARRDAAYRRALAVADASAAAIALLITKAVVGPDHPDLATLITVPLIVVIGKVIGIYDQRESAVRKSTLDEAPALFQLATLFAVIGG